VKIRTASAKEVPIAKSEVTVHTGYKGVNVSGKGIFCTIADGSEHLVSGTTKITNAIYQGYHAALDI